VTARRRVALCSWLGCLLCCWGGRSGHADVDLLRAAPSRVAVSSTVDNAKIKPEHLVDGDLGTAWNSRTNDLVGAWIAFRVPATATVASIKLTVGFTKVDRKLGDLFTQNPRIKKVEVKRDRRSLGQFVLDPDNRELQTIVIQQAGGDYQLTVLELVPGTKTAWRETSISELQVWGSLGAGERAKPSRPALRLASLDAYPALSKDACIKAAFPNAKGRRIGDERITRSAEYGLTATTTICMIEHRPADADEATDATSEIVAVTRATKAVIGRTQVKLINGPKFDRSAPDGKSEDVDSGTVEFAPFPLTTSETALLVDAIQSTSGPHAESETTTSTLYRVSPKGLEAILTVVSSWEKDVESGSSNRCAIDAPKLGRDVPKHLVLQCSSTKEDWHNEDLSRRGTNYAERTETATWNGATYDYTPGEP
jgi:hypothetical protein